MSTATAGRPPVHAQWLGYGGLIPFGALAVASWLVEPGYRSAIQQALVAYAATIAAFVGALHWGIAMRDGDHPSTAMLAWGVVPSLVAWLALLMHYGAGLLLVALLLATCYGVDRSTYPRLGLAGWLPMRLRLTAVAALSCVAAAASTFTP